MLGGECLRLLSNENATLSLADHPLWARARELVLYKISSSPSVQRCAPAAGSQSSAALLHESRQLAGDLNAGIEVLVVPSGTHNR
jgi:hypothetical protein